MWRPAVWRFGAAAALVAGAATAACWTGAPPASPALANHLEASAPDPSGAYWCSIDESGYDYPRFPCAIGRRGDRLELVKLGGSQRFTGEITPDGQNGFSFEGKLFCPYGACDQALHGTFRQTARGQLTGKFLDSPITVTMVPAPRGALTATGGAGYGGAGYGGNLYGGGTIPGP